MTLKSDLWLIATKAELVRKLSAEIDAIAHELGDEHEVFDPSDMDWDRAEVISGAMLDENYLYVVRDGKRENLAKSERQTVILYEDNKDDNEKIVDSIDYFVVQERGLFEDEYYGNVYFVLDESEGKLTLLRVFFET